MLYILDTFLSPSFEQKVNNPIVLISASFVSNDVFICIVFWGGKSGNVMYVCMYVYMFGWNIKQFIISTN